MLTALALTVYVGVLFLSPWLSKMLPVGLKILDGFPKVKKSYLSLIDGLLLLSNVRKKIIFLIRVVNLVFAFRCSDMVLHVGCSNFTLVCRASFFDHHKFHWDPQPDARQCWAI